MTLYFINPNENYLEKVADYLISHHLDNFANIKVIVPNTIACSSLQQLLVKNIKNSASFLPNIIPIDSLAEEGEFAYKMPSNAITVAPYLEQKLILIDIIQKYSAINFSLLQAAYLSDELLRLFNEFESWNIKVNSLSNLVEIDSAEHWMKITDFLIYSYNLWKKRLEERKKIDQITYQKTALKLEEENGCNITILACIVSDIPFLKNFIKHLATSPHGIVILPPFYKSSIKKELKPISPFYKIKELIKYTNISEEDVKILPSSKLDNIIPKIEYIQLSDLLEEAETIALIAANSAKDEKIAIVTNNHELINLCSIALSKYGLLASNLHGMRLISTKNAELALLISESVITRDIIKFTALLKTPFLISNDIYKFEMEFLRKPAIDTIEKLLESVDVKSEQNIEPLHFFLDGTSSLYRMSKAKASFKDLLTAHMEAITNLAPNVWNGDEGNALYKFFVELIEIADVVEFIDASFYPVIIKQLLSYGKFFGENNSNIFILSDGDSAFLEMDKVIIADCNDGSIRKNHLQDPWMSNKMRKSIGMPSIDDFISTQHYYFSLLLNKKNVFITRSTKNSAIESKFVTEFLLSNNQESRLTHSYDWQRAAINIFNTEHLDLPESVGYSSHLPSSISATNIELLVRNPYIFYAKNILRLKKIDDINKDLSFSDFGTLIHNIIALYTEMYESLIHLTQEQKLDVLIEKGRGVFDEFHLDKKKRAWWSKFTDIASGFIDFDEKRRVDLSEVYSEIYGETVLSIGSHNIKITAIADRLEYTKSGNLHIIDYKTGIVPTKQDVIRGISPQLIIEAIIALEGGFKQIKPFTSATLTYVKVTNSKEAYNETSIEMSIEEITHHKQGLIDLLTYYINSGIFCSNADSAYSPQYNDYRHLERIY